MHAGDESDAKPSESTSGELMMEAEVPTEAKESDPLDDPSDFDFELDDESDSEFSPDS